MAYACEPNLLNKKILHQDSSNDKLQEKLSDAIKNSIKEFSSNFRG